MKTPDYCIHNDKEIKGFFGEYRWLSNFWNAPVYYEKLRFPCVECAYHAAKTKDIGERCNFMYSPQEAKKYGRLITLREDWEKVKYDIMSSLVFDKFFRNLELRKQLLKTGDAYLEESNNWHDLTWGNCVCAKHKLIEGANLLGIILMKTRKFWK